MSDKKPKRREFLFTATYAVGAVGVGAVVWPLVDQMNPDASVKALASTEVDVSSVQPGNTITVLWRGKPVFIRRRTPDEIAEAKSVKMEDLIHPEKDEDRVKDPEWLVMLGVCTHPKCVHTPSITSHSGFFALSSSFSGCIKSSILTDFASAISSGVLLLIKTGLPLQRTVIVFPG